MNYRLGNNKDIKAIGDTAPLSCPHCGKISEFGVYSNANLDIIPKLPIIKNSTVYFLICPHCASVYGVNESAGKAFEKGEKLAIGNFDFKELKSFDA